MTLLTDLAKVQQELERVEVQLAKTTRQVASHEEQISGDRGISITLVSLANEIRSLRKAAYWVGGIIVSGSITFAFSVLQLTGHV